MSSPSASPFGAAPGHGHLAVLVELSASMGGRPLLRGGSTIGIGSEGKTDGSKIAGALDGRGLS